MAFLSSANRIPIRSKFRLGRGHMGSLCVFFPFFASSHPQHTLSKKHERTFAEMRRKKSPHRKCDLACSSFFVHEHTSSSLNWLAKTIDRLVFLANFSTLLLFLLSLYVTYTYVKGLF